MLRSLTDQNEQLALIGDLEQIASRSYRIKLPFTGVDQHEPIDVLQSALDQSRSLLHFPGQIPAVRFFWRPFYAQKKIELDYCFAVYSRQS